MRVLSLFAMSLGFASTVLATPYKRFDGISVELAGPAASVSSVEDLKFTATVSNSGSEDVRVLKYGTILDDKLPTRSFKVTKDGEAVPFTGIKLQVSLPDLDDTAFVTIPAGDKITVVHAVAPLFDFAAAGPGKFTFEPNTNFQVIGTEDRVASPELTKLDATSSSVEVEVTGDLKKRELVTVDKRAVSTCTNASRKSFIDASYAEAKTLASTASSYVTSKGANDSLYRAYYGATATSRVASVFNAVATEGSNSRTLSCTDTYGACTSGVIAYTLIASTNIYFCSIFFNEVATSNLCGSTTVASRNVRGGTTLHELTHAVAGTDDVTYGCSADQALSDANSYANADNYNCFSTQVYANTRC
ncbi:Metalloprotease [Pluteus cervinus]|uniref:Metalloprotease n=1 Tax=Pluteus cervinus TaxID=181527 RepID=A0ACD3AVN6_9AGAR|nr:Metalloprotease [Pluteus cervinus]